MHRFLVIASARTRPAFLYPDDASAGRGREAGRRRARTQAMTVPPA